MFDHKNVVQTPSAVGLQEHSEGWLLEIRLRMLVRFDHALPKFG